ncbi:TetR/AcrR family transcriptional regulator [Sandaracinobacteroides saxicola]|uniref:TetR/AcrR family transcriptional regulator n=1 Tax=Sandaracinobacteroides saxicola TaxID=2759707 RepID=A0A7G5ILH7_9SPHN|nr:TetR/AcrR family transcriptional regulator [Sandaracinobacteroides saxicola]QMW24219.1 TetR/AcrR family transcriptional regulator [Sandaracinobacteroides saxicola]
MSSAPVTRKQVRLHPQKRQSLILDCTAELIASEGIAKLSMDRIGREAGVSKSLVYAYFPSLTDLLRQLLQREMRRLRRLQAAAAEGAETFEGLVRAVTHEYLKYIEERGLIIERLQAEPSVSTLHDPTQFGREVAVDYLAEIVIDQFDLPREVAYAATEISFGLPSAAGAFLLHHNLSRAALETLTVSMILGTFYELKREHVARHQPLQRRTPAAAPTVDIVRAVTAGKSHKVRATAAGKGKRREPAE